MRKKVLKTDVITGLKYGIFARYCRSVLVLMVLFSLNPIITGCTQSEDPGIFKSLEKYQIKYVEYYIEGSRKYIDGDLQGAIDSWGTVEQVLDDQAEAKIADVKKEIERVDKLILLGQVSASDTIDQLKEAESFLEEAYFIYRNRNNIITELEDVRTRIKNSKELTKAQIEAYNAFKCIKDLYYYLDKNLSKSHDETNSLKARLVSSYLAKQYNTIETKIAELRGIENDQKQKDQLITNYHLASKRLFSYVEKYGSLVTQAVKLYCDGDCTHNVESLNNSIEKAKLAGTFLKRTTDRRMTDRTNNTVSSFCQALAECAEKRKNDITKWTVEFEKLKPKLNEHYVKGLAHFKELRFQAAERIFREIRKIIISKMPLEAQEAGFDHYKDEDDMIDKCVLNDGLFKEGNNHIQTWKLKRAEDTFKAIRHSHDSLAASKRMSFYLSLSGELKKKYSEARRYYGIGDIDKAFGNISYVMQHATKFEDDLDLQKKIGATYEHMELLRNDYINCRFKNLSKDYQEGKRKFSEFSWPDVIIDLVEKGEKIGPLWKDAEMKIATGFYKFAFPLLEKCLDIDPAHEKIRKTLKKTQKKL